MTHLPHSLPIDYQALKDVLSAAKTESELHSAIVNAPFQYKLETTFLFLGIIVLLLVDKQEGIKRITLSNTELADNTLRISAKRFEDIVIPLAHPTNIIAKAIETGEPQGTSDWQYLFTPALSAEEARLNQAAGAISYSAVYPLKAGEGGALIFSYYQYPEHMEDLQRHFMEQYVAIVSERLRAK